MDRRRKGGSRTRSTGSRNRREDLPDPPDAEWDEFLKKAEESVTASEWLISEFAKQSKTPGQCTSYLRKIINRTFKRHQQNLDNEDQCADTILQALFQLTLRSWSIPENVVTDMMSLGMAEARHFSSSALQRIITNYCLIYILENANSDLPAGWIDMFGKVAAALTTRGDIPHEGDIIDGREYRKYIVTEICRMDWSKKIVNSLIKVIEEIPGLDITEVDIILGKLGGSLKAMKSSAIPDVMNRIVTLTGHFRPSFLLETCDGYFGSAKRYLKDTATVTAAERTALATIAFHFVDASRHCEPIVREVLSRVKASVYDHTLVMSPFILSVVLGMTSVDYLRHSIVEPLKIAIMKSFHEINLSEASLWYRNTRGKPRDIITTCFEAVLQAKSNSLEYMSEGLKELGIGLLSAESLHYKYPMISKRCTELGLFLITSIIQSNKGYLGGVMNELLKHKTTPHIECLAACLNKCSRAVGHRDFLDKMHELLQHLPLMTVESVSMIVKSLMPALQMSAALLDELMIVLRKTFWKSETAGRICVEAMCVVLSNSVILGNIPGNEMRGQGVADDLLFSQCTQVGTQGGLNSDRDFAPLCFEILSLAKRFFLLSCKVREQMYLGLHRVSRSNPMLTEIIGGLLVTHISKYMPQVVLKEVDETCVTLNGVFEFSSTNLSFASINDELGFLVQCIGFVIQKAPSNSHEEPTYRSCRALMENWIVFAININFDTLEMIASSILVDAGSSRPLEVARYVKDVLVMQSMQVIEALIEYIALMCVRGKGTFRSPHNKIEKLHRNYQELVKSSIEELLARKGKSGEKGKTGGKGGGKKGRKKKPEVQQNSTTDDDSASVTSERDSVNPTAPKQKKLEVLVKPEYHHLMNLDSVCQMLRDIYGISNQSNVPINQNVALQSVKESCRFEMLLLETVKQKVSKLIQKKPIRERLRAPRDTHNALSLIGNVIWKRLCVMVQIQKDDGELLENTEVVEARLEVIAEILEFFYSIRLSDQVLNFHDLDADKKVPSSASSTTSLFVQWKEVLKLATSVYDGVQGNANALLFTILNFVCKELSESDMLEKIRKWTWKYLRSNDVPQDSEGESVGSVDLLENVIALFATCTAKCSTFPQKDGNDILRLAKAIHVVIGDTEGDDPQNREHSSWLITEGTVPALLSSLLPFVELQLNMVTTILGRLKAHGDYIGLVKCADMREKCFEMIDCVRLICTELVRTAFPAGPCASSLLKVVPQIYQVTASFSEYLLDLSRKKIHLGLDSFKDLVGALGKDFKTSIETMIQHNELSQRLMAEEMTNQKKKGKNTSKVPAALKNQFNKDARLVPNLIYQIEKFEQTIISLSTKLKVNMLYGMKLSASRDFRIETGKFQEVVAQSDSDKASDETVNQSTAAEAKPKKGRKRKAT